MDIESHISAWWSKGPLPRAFEMQWDKEIDGSLEDVYFKKFGAVSAPLYDLLITQHLGSGHPALYWTNSEGEKSEYTFDHLNKAALFLCRQWRGLAVNSGERIALATQLDFNGLASLLAAVRLGLHIGYFAQKTRYTSNCAECNKMREFAPKWIVDPTGEIALEGVSHLPNELGESGIDEDQSAHTYTEDEPLYGEVAFGKWWHAALFDGIVTHRLEKGLSLSMPYCSPLRYEPYCQLLSLLFGVGIHRMESEDLDGLSSLQADILVLHPRLIEHFEGELPFKKKPLKMVRDPLTGGEECWQVLVSRGGLKGITLIDWVCESRFGGGILHSRRKLKEAEWLLPVVEPTPLYPYELDAKTPIALTPLRVELRDQWLMARLEPAWVDGQSVSISSVEKSVQSLCRKACLLALPQHRDMLISKLIMILFIDEGVDRNSLRLTIRKRICREIGEAFIPEEIFCTSLTPPLKEGAVDRCWVRNQWLDGLLQKKEHKRLYRDLHQLRYILQSEAT